MKGYEIDHLLFLPCIFYFFHFHLASFSVSSVSGVVNPLHRERLLSEKGHLLCARFARESGLVGPYPMGYANQ